MKTASFLLVAMLATATASAPAANVPEERAIVGTSTSTVHAADVAISRAAFGSSTTNTSRFRVTLDHCQDCWIWPEHLTLLDEWYADWFLIANDDGICTYDTSPPDPAIIDSCARCPSWGEYGCDEDDNSTANFTDREDAIEAAEQESGCGNCEYTRGQLLSVMNEVDRLDATRLAQIISESDGAVWLNEERGAVQARGCSVNAVLHLQVSEEFRREILAATVLIQSASKN